MGSLLEQLKANLATKLSEYGDDDGPEDVSIKVTNSEARLKEILKEFDNKSVPPFYMKLPGPNEAMMLKIREEARELFMYIKQRDLFDQDELTQLYMELEKNATPPFNNINEKYINYTDYKRTINGLTDKYKKFLNAKIFISFMSDDPYGRVPVSTIFNYVMKKTWLNQTRFGLCIYDETGKGSIKESGMESYITELIPTLSQLNEVDASFLPFYICTAVRKFFFFLDPNRTGQIKILDILSSGFIDDILDLREEEPPRETNWFSIASVMKAYGRYLNLDADHNGMLSQEEFLKYGGGCILLTGTFVDRLYQECLTFDKEMDYRTYLDFVLAFENLNEPQSIQYFFRLLDFDHKGYLDGFTLHYFYKDISKYLENQGQGTECILFEDVKDEVFDMVKPKNPNRIDLQDLIKCGKAATIIQLLIDFNGFWSYETREALLPDLSRKEDSDPRSSDV